MLMFSLIVVATDAATDDATNGATDDATPTDGATADATTDDALTLTLSDIRRLCPARYSRQISVDYALHAIRDSSAAIWNGESNN